MQLSREEIKALIEYWESKADSARLAGNHALKGQCMLRAFDARVMLSQTK